ncbi:MAG: DUF72 domain-containing protein [Nitriliruptorales bacterium]|nr:DUF72 domain-containing protein [Nitriliruptorales bacterium]
MADIRVGTSGWQYDDWDGTFYPDEVAKKRWYEHYATVFPTVEINYSFYRLPRGSTVEGWNRKAPDRFRYAIKGSRYITHNLKLGEGTDEAIGNVVGRLEPLKSFLGVWLWQLPPNLHRDVERLDRFLGLLPGRHRHAVEFRHGSWFEDDVFEVLSRHGAACVWISDRQMPDAYPVTADFVYVRFHGLSEQEGERYRYDYSDEELRPWADRLLEQQAAGRDGWVYFNNDYQARAPQNALTLIEMLGDAAFDWP